MNEKQVTEENIFVTLVIDFAMGEQITSNIVYADLEDFLNEIKLQFKMCHHENYSFSAE
jgi:hypothetical protein